MGCSAGRKKKSYVSISSSESVHSQLPNTYEGMRIAKWEYRQDIQTFCWLFVARRKTNSW